jgi:hypothetical protein
MAHNNTIAAGPRGRACDAGCAVVLALFTSGPTPDAEDAWRMLVCVGVATWLGCTEEAAFLEADLLEHAILCNSLICATIHTSVKNLELIK